MKTLIMSFSAEFLKARKSNVLLIIAIVFMFIPSMMALLFYVAKNPELASKLGLIGTKADMFGHGDWNAYMELTLQIVAVLGLIGFGFVTVWVFGREYTDRTISDLLALPISRTKIVIAKFMLTILFCMVLSLLLFAMSIFMGKLAGIDGWSKELIREVSGKYTVIALLTIVLCTPTAFFACYGKGFMLPLGFIIFTIIMAQIAGVIGLGPYFPWAIPGVYSIPEAIEGFVLSRISYIILFTTSIVGALGTMAWWQYADQK